VATLLGGKNTVLVLKTHKVSYLALWDITSRFTGVIVWDGVGHFYVGSSADIVISGLIATRVIALCEVQMICDYRMAWQNGRFPK
jgi:hypothetical protein